MREQLFVPTDISRMNQMTQSNNELVKKENDALLSSLSLEVDDIFFSLRKADQIIRRELNMIRNNKHQSLKNYLISPIHEEKLKRIIEQLSPYHLLVDEYIVYMLDSPNNSIFHLIREYNQYLEERKRHLENTNYSELINIDERLVHYIRHLGAMIYHLNIHLNLLTVLLKNASLVAETQQTAIRASQEVVTEYMVNEWSKPQQDVRFLEVTIEGSYAIVTWAIEDLRGDAILLQDEGYWQLMNISAGMLGIKDLENADVPFDVAQRMLRLHHQKLGY